MRIGAIVLLAASFVACTHEDTQPVAYPQSAAPPVVYAPSPYPPPSQLPPPWQTGLATWYGGSFAGKPTSNGERYDPRGMTAAHRTLPFNTWVEVRRPETGASVVVRINDRGPWGHAKRVIDLSQGAAERLGTIPLGPTPVEIRIVRPPY